MLHTYSQKQGDQQGQTVRKVPRLKIEDAKLHGANHTICYDNTVRELIMLPVQNDISDVLWSTLVVWPVDTILGFHAVDIPFRKSNIWFHRAGVAAISSTPYLFIACMVPFGVDTCKGQRLNVVWERLDAECV